MKFVINSYLPARWAPRGTQLKVKTRRQVSNTRGTVVTVKNSLVVWGRPNGDASSQEKNSGVTPAGRMEQWQREGYESFRSWRMKIPDPDDELAAVRWQTYVQYDQTDDWGNHSAWHFLDQDEEAVRWCVCDSSDED